jgi:hypothetical protein
MAEIKDNRIDQCLNDIHKYEVWGKYLSERSLAYIFNSNTPTSELAIHNGLKYFKAKIKLSVLEDNNHSEEEKNKRLTQIEAEIQYLEESMKNNLKYRGLLMRP